jgi:hypothetical protein
MSQQINLFDPAFRKQRHSYTSTAALLQYFGGAVAIAALIAAYVQTRLETTQVQAQAIDRAVKDATARRDKLTAEFAQQKPDARLEAEIVALEMRLKVRKDALAILESGAIGNTDGFSEFMRALSRQNMGGLWLTAFDIGLAGNALAIEGRTLNADLVAGYLKQLNREKALQGRPFAALRISQPRAESPPAPVAATGTDSRSRKEAGASAAPRYLEFTISTLDIGVDTKAPGPLATANAPLLGKLDATAMEIAKSTGGAR